MTGVVLSPLKEHIGGVAFSVCERRQWVYVYIQKCMDGERAGGGKEEDNKWRKGTVEGESNFEKSNERGRDENIEQEGGGMKTFGRYES